MYKHQAQKGPLNDNDFLTSISRGFLYSAAMQPGPIPTLGELQRATPWGWLWCERCQHHAPLACAVAVIRWGADASSDRLRQRARCSACGRKGATIQHPGYRENAFYFLGRTRPRVAWIARCAFRQV